MEHPPTYFAAPEKASPEQLAAERKTLLAHPLIRHLLDSVPESVVILNRQRQIVVANNKLAAMLHCDEESLLGLRIGDAVHCIRAQEEPAGCGTSPFCKLCGASQAMVNSQSFQSVDVKECRIQCLWGNRPVSLDLRVWSTPLTVNGTPFTVFAIHDIADEKRRQVLERLFFHDVLNCAGGLHGILKIWPEMTGQQAVEIEHMAQHLSEQLIEEIESQRDLAAAERGDLVVTRKNVDVVELLVQLCVLYSHHTVADRRKVAPPRITGDAVLYTSEVLLRRVLGNLIKNALEASEPGQTVTVSYRNDGVPLFTVHNESCMPEAAQLQMFQRSFSTKNGVGRGIGSYCVKLLTEQYLHGSVSFTTSPEAGTTFTLRLPSN